MTSALPLGYLSSAWRSGPTPNTLWLLIFLTKLPIILDALTTVIGYWHTISCHLCVDAFLTLPSSCDRLHSGNHHRWTPFSPCFGSDSITATLALALGTFSNRFGPCVTPSQTPSPPWSPFPYYAFLYLMTLILNYSGRGEVCFIQE